MATLTNISWVANNYKIWVVSEIWFERSDYSNVNLYMKRVSHNAKNYENVNDEHD